MEYRLPMLEDERLVKSYIEDYYSHNENPSKMLMSMKFEQWVEKINNNEIIADGKWGKSLTYLAIDNNKLIGILSIRYDLPDNLIDKYGHIGYEVRPSERRKGYSTKMLKYALEECKRLGMNKVVLGCYKDNIGSAKTIIKNGGKLIKEVDVIQKISDNWKINLISQYYEIKL